MFKYAKNEKTNFDLLQGFQAQSWGNILFEYLLEQTSTMLLLLHYENPSLAKNMDRAIQPERDTDSKELLH